MTMNYIDRPCDNERCNHPCSDDHYIPEYGQAQCDACLHAQVVIPCDDYQDHGDWLATMIDTAKTIQKYRVIS